MDVSIIDLIVPPRRYARVGIMSDPARRWLPVVSITRTSLWYSDNARLVVSEGLEAAGRLRHGYVGTEHLLLGLIAGQNTAVATLTTLGVDLAAVRQQVEEIIGTGQAAPTVQAVFTPRARRSLQLAQVEATGAGTSRVGSEHILAGMIREGEGVAAQVLLRLGTDLGSVRRRPR